MFKNGGNVERYLRMSCNVGLKTRNTHVMSFWSMLSMWPVFLCAVSAVPGVEWSVWQSQGGQRVPGATEKFASADTGKFFGFVVCYDVLEIW